ncbi:hypothetical protein L2U69_15025 [Zavarzinia compransoris]|uniref:hypothetical protein n=1 Tax=Zavarzinia marina TaxID=2911065 RepID=UPI001F1E5CE1|nr:hypothetical protein [Zavarzinia marina]MCF4166964.1 hypothetical protein [Zavarzinia marina]
MSDKDTETNAPAVQYQVVAAGGAAQIIAFPACPASTGQIKAEEANKTASDAD